MLSALASLLRHETPGLKEWMAANAVAFVSFILYALGRQLPPWLAYEAANVTYALSGALALAGFRRFFSCPVPVAALSAGLTVYSVTVALFHYAYDSFVLRTLTVSAFQVAILSAMALTIFRARERWHAPYPYLFTAIAAVLYAAANVVRAAVHIWQAGEVTSLLQPSASGIVFMSAGAFVLPLLTFGAVMMAHDRTLASTGHPSRRDFLTGALTRKAFDELLERESARAGTSRRKLALLMLDVDDMKSINARFGHAVGDQVLMDIALAADRALRQRDSFARIGGTEFAILLADADQDHAVATAHRLLALIRRARSHPDKPDCSISIGLATLCKREALAETVKRVKQAREDARAAGGNRVVCAAPAGCARSLENAENTQQGESAQALAALAEAAYGAYGAHQAPSQGDMPAARASEQLRSHIAGR
ncbi:GGDEF domain-containing protein [Noviherbaspirillum agri]